MRSPLIVLVRHEESQKTLLESFGDVPGDTITAVGRQRAQTIGRALQQYVRSNSLGIELHCASSDRACQTAAIIGRSVAVSPNVLDMASINLGPISGLTSGQVTQRFPRFAAALSLYRAGLFNSYDLPFPKGAEPPMEFERRTFGIFQRVVKQARSDLLVFVLHRSPMTAILISIARHMNVYPRKFYGVVPISPGECFLIRSLADDLKLLKPNVQPVELSRTLASVCNSRNR